MLLRGKGTFYLWYLPCTAAGTCFNTESQTSELFPQSCHVVYVAFLKIFIYIFLTVQPFPRSIASLFCHFVSSLFTHTGLSMSVPMTTPPLPSSPRSSSLLTPLPCYKRRRGRRKASVASYLNSTQGHVDSFVIRSSVRTGCLASDVMETHSRFQMNYICSQLEQLGWQIRSSCRQFVPWGWGFPDYEEWSVLLYVWAERFILEMRRCECGQNR